MYLVEHHLTLKYQKILTQIVIFGIWDSPRGDHNLCLNLCICITPGWVQDTIKVLAMQLRLASCRESTSHWIIVLSNPQIMSLMTLYEDSQQHTRNNSVGSQESIRSINVKKNPTIIRSYRNEDHGMWPTRVNRSTKSRIIEA